MNFLCKALSCLLLLALPTTGFAYSNIAMETSEPKSLEFSSVPLPSSRYAPKGATRVPILSFKVEASCGGDVRLKYIRVQGQGLITNNDIHGVYMLKGFRRLSRRIPLSSDDRTALLRFHRGGVLIPACESETFTVAADFKRTASVGGEFAISIEFPEDIVTQDDVEVLQDDFPIRATLDPVSITPPTFESESLVFTPLPIGVVKSGRTGRIGKFMLESKGSDHILYSITLTNEGTAHDEDIRRLTLKRHLRGEPVTDIASRMDGDSVTLRFRNNALYLPKGSKLIFNLVGYPMDSGKTLKFTLKEPGDIYSSISRRFRGAAPILD